MTAAAHDPQLEARFKARYLEAKKYSAAIDGPSLAMRLMALPRERYLEILRSISRVERAQLLYAWGFWARGKQHPKHLDRVTHRIALYMAGRGFGKSKVGAERTRHALYRGVKSLALIGPTETEVSRWMVGGKLGAKGNGSGLLDVFPPHERAQIVVKKEDGEILFPWLGATVYLNSAERPELRGPNLGFVWADELAKWRYMGRLWDNIELATRAKSDIPVEILVTTTPRPLRFLRELVADVDTLTITGTTDENACNLDDLFVARLHTKFGNTRTGRQEREGELLGDVEGALFNAETIDRYRVDEAPRLVRIVVAVDPAIATGAENDETGLAVVGIDAEGHCYILAAVSGRWSPEQWGAEALKLYSQHKADAFVGERNRGGDLVASNIRATVRWKKGQHAVAKVEEVHATRNKEIRAEPVSTICDMGRLHFVGVWPEAERQLTEWSPVLGGKSPNILDAIVWGVYSAAKLEEDDDKPDPHGGFPGLLDLAAAVGDAGPSRQVNTAAVPPSASLAAALASLGGGRGGRI